MHAKIRLYRRRHGRWEYVCSTTHFATRDEAREEFLRRTTTLPQDARAEFAATHGYDLGETA